MNENEQMTLPEILHFLWVQWFVEPEGDVLLLPQHLRVVGFLRSVRKCVPMWWRGE